MGRCQSPLPFAGRWGKPGGGHGPACRGRRERGRGRPAGAAAAAGSSERRGCWSGGSICGQRRRPRSAIPGDSLESRGDRRERRRSPCPKALLPPQGSAANILHTPRGERSFGGCLWIGSEGLVWLFFPWPGPRCSRQRKASAPPSSPAARHAVPQTGVPGTSLPSASQRI